MDAIGEFVHRHRAVVLPLAGSVCLVAILLIVWRIGTAISPPASAPRIAQAWFYDIDAQTLYTAPADSEGVRAMVFSCGSCNDPGERFIGWLETPDTDFVEPELLADSDDTPSAFGDEPSGLLVRSEHGDQWHPAESGPAQAIFQAAQARCGEGATLRPCTPPSVVER